jgi:EAL domain-containing protein (putative c-di-GMP-specific phosphodiesterase class I)
MAKIRVLIADDDVILREALAEVIRSDPACELVGEAGGAGEAISMANNLRPDVAVVDVKMPDGGGSRATSEIRQKSPRTKILGFSAYGDRDTVFDLLRCGASGFLVKGSSPGALLEGIHNVHEGRSPLSPSVAHEVVSRLAETLEKDTEAESHQIKRQQRLKQAMAGGMRIAYQPIVRLSDRQVVGHEALARFDGEPGSGPEQWFADAAEAGMLIDFELAAVRAGIATQPRMPGTYLSLNVSPETVLSGRLQSATVGAGPWVGEITEHAPVADYENLARALAPLKEKGMRLAVDDAGAGFASLRHILLLEPQLIKLDVSLTRGIDTNKHQRGLASALATFANEIGATVVAEGIETEGELATLKSLGVEYGQGFLFGKPEVPRADS